MPQWFENFSGFAFLVIIVFGGIAITGYSNNPDTDDILMGAINYLNTEDFDETFHTGNTTLVEKNDSTLTLLVDGETYYTHYSVSENIFTREVSFSSAQKSN